MAAARDAFGRASRRPIRGVAVEAVLADVQEQARQLDRRELDERAVIAAQVVQGGGGVEHEVASGGDFAAAEHEHSVFSSVLNTTRTELARLAEANGLRLDEV